MNPSGQLIEISGAIAIALVGLAFAAQKFFNGWKQGSAEASVLDLMHQELGRMSEQNTILSNELNRLQLELVSLNKELYKLTIENQRLHTEVAALTGEINRLKTKLDNREDTP